MNDHAKTDNPKTTLTPERQWLYEQIATLVAGHSASDVLAALADNLAQAAAFVSADPDAAEGLLASLVPDMARDLRAGWHHVVEAKAQGSAMAGVQVA